METSTPTDYCPRCDAFDSPGTPPGGSWWWPADQGQWYCRHCKWYSGHNEKMKKKKEPTTTNDQRTDTDCLRCCVATLLNLPYEEVPDFLADHDLEWAAGIANWALQHGYQTLRFQSCGDGEMLQSLAGAEVPWIATGPTSRGTDHAVIYKDDVMVYDPHKSRSGLAEITGALIFIPTATKAPKSSLIAILAEIEQQLNYPVVDEADMREYKALKICKDVLQSLGVTTD